MGERVLKDHSVSRLAGLHRISPFFLDVPASCSSDTKNAADTHEKLIWVRREDYLLTAEEHINVTFPQMDVQGLRL
jgi:hypothetical protein